MLRVTLTVHTREADMIGSLEIVNTGTGMPDYGTYACTLLDADRHVLHHAEVSHYPRYLGAWGLVHRALRALEPLSRAVPVPGDEGA